MKGWAIAIIGGWLIQLAIWGGVIWAAIHFIRKWW